MAPPIKLKECKGPGIGWQPYHGNHGPRAIPRPIVFAVRLPQDPAGDLRKYASLSKVKSSPELRGDGERAHVLGGLTAQLASGGAPWIKDRVRFSTPKPSARPKSPSGSASPSRPASAGSGSATGSGSRPGSANRSRPGSANQWKRIQWRPPRHNSVPAARNKEIVDKQSAKLRPGSASRAHQRTSVEDVDPRQGSGMYKSLHEKKQIAEALEMLAGMQVTWSALVERLLRPHYGDTKYPQTHYGGLLEALEETDEDQLLTAVRHLGADVKIRLQAMLVLARIFCLRGPGSSKAEILEIAKAVQQESAGLVREPCIALELAEIFDEGLEDMKAPADMIYKELERDVMKGDRAYHPHMLLDLAERHHKQGRTDRARRLWKMSCAVRPGDVRTRTRTYRWRFESEPPVPDDGFRVEQPASLAAIDLKFMHLSGGLMRGCPCGLGRCCSCGYVDEMRKGSDLGDSLEAVAAGPNPIPEYVRRELDRFGFSSGLAALTTEPQGENMRRDETTGTLIHNVFGTPATAARFKQVERAAWHVAKSRRFHLNIVDKDAAAAEVDVSKAGDSSSRSNAETETSAAESEIFGG